jgi:transcription initiation factor TFIID TATA-box-binding protein
MTDIIVENIIAYAKVADELDIYRISEKVPGFMYDPTEFLGLTLKLEKPSVAILLLPNGKIICTGVKNFEDVSKAIEIMKDKILSIGAL